MFESDIFRNKLDGFCEVTIYGEHPEYINSYTSLFMSIIGILGIYNNYHSCQNIYFLYASLFFNGLCSFMYHWTAYYGWGIFDAVTMILIAIFSINSIIEELKYLYKLTHRNLIINILPIIYFTFMIVPPCVNNDDIFRILFGLFLVFVLIFILVIHNKIEHISGLDFNIIKNAYRGVGYIALAGGFWITTEIFCDSFWLIRYIPGHPIWHFYVSYGGYQIAQLVSALYILRHNNTYQYNNTKDIVHRYFPSITEYYYSNIYNSYIKVK
jgi:hypothetical protein